MLIAASVWYPAHSQDWLCHFKEEALRMLGAGAEMVPDGDENNGNDEDERGDGVDFGSDAAAEAAPNFERKRVFAAVEKKSDGDFVHGEREDEESGGDQRKFQIRESDEPESAPGSCAKIERSLFLATIHFLQTGKEFGGGDGDQRGAMAEKDSDEAEVQADADGEKEQ